MNRHGFPLPHHLTPRSMSHDCRGRGNDDHADISGSRLRLLGEIAGKANYQIWEVLIYGRWHRVEGRKCGQYVRGAHH